MKALHVPVDGPAEVVEVDPDDVEAMQRLVGGYFEAFRAENDRLTLSEKWSGKYGRCAMVSPSGLRCVLPYMHRLGHRTTPATGNPQ